MLIWDFRLYHKRKLLTTIHKRVSEGNLEKELKELSEDWDISSIKDLQLVQVD
jgi:hypothetical protein